MRTVISALGAAAALGFIAASAYSNYLFSATIATNVHELHLYRALAVLAVICNALCPFFIKFNRRARNHVASAGALLLWLFAVPYSLTAAFGLAASSREWSANKIENTIQTKEDIRAEIADLKIRKRTYAVNLRIDELNRKLERQGEIKTADPQSAFLAKLTGQDTTTIRIALAILYAVFVELGSALLLYIALAHFDRKDKANGTQTATAGTTDGTVSTATSTGDGRAGQLQLRGTSRPQPAPPGPAKKTPRPRGAGAH